MLGADKPAFFALPDVSVFVVNNARSKVQPGTDGGQIQVASISCPGAAITCPRLVIAVDYLNARGGEFIVQETQVFANHSMTLMDQARNR